MPGIKKVRTGKVREVFDLGDRFLLVASDRISAFDVIMPNGIPRKGEVLTQISHFWFEKFSALVPNHLLAKRERSVAEKFAAVRRATRAPLDDREKGQAARHRVHRARLPFRQRLEGIQKIADRLRHQSCPPA